LFTVETITQRDRWNDALRALPYAHILQTWEWGEFKRETTGWQPLRFAFKREREIVGMASVGVRRIGLFALMYASKGPALNYADPQITNFTLNFLEKLARRHFAVWLKIDPDVVLATGVPNDADDKPDTVGQALTANLQARGWRFSADQIQFRNTVNLDLAPTEDELLAAMSQNTRRKVRVAQRDGVSVRVGTVDDLPLLYELYQQTGTRDGFLIRPRAYYLHEWRYLIEAGLAQPLIAEYAGKALAHVILFHFGRKCWYFYGASSNEERDKMPNYLLQWEAMRWAKAHGYALYDMWGAPNEFVESDGMWGVYQFKRGFRGTVTRHIGAWDTAPYPLLYKAYTELYPRVLAWLRGQRGTA
jgi:lipid II:glycine glycyltransferase (peptidoglycan interpeptide bridge formation enzyme)